MRTIKILNLILIILLLLEWMLPAAQAADLNRTTGSLTIVKYEINSEKEDEYDDENGILMSGVTFAIYKIDDDSESTVVPEGESAVDSKVTGNDGKVTFEDLPLGRYLVVEVSAPANVVSKIANFIVDIPMTEADGTTLEYDVEVYPKNNTVYGGIVLTKYGNDETDVLSDVEFELQVKEGESWSRYVSETYTADTTLKTEADGTITIEGLPAGTYRFVEISTQEGYILDNSKTYEFSVSLDNSGNTIVSPETISVYNEKPEIEKVISNESMDSSYTTGDTISFEITTDVPSTIASLVTYTLKDELPEGLDIDTSSLEVYGENNNIEEKITTGFNWKQDSLTITLTFDDLSTLDGYTSLVVRYDATLNSYADATSIGNTNTATLTYSTIVKTDYNGSENTDITNTDTATVTVYTGGFWIEKRANSISGDLLDGAIFKLASSETNAKNGTYMTDENGDEIILTTSSGIASYKGLAYGTYYLVEVQSPYDSSSGRYYNLLTSPVEITVTADTYSSTSSTATIVNKMGFTLPVTGGMGIAGILVVGVALIGTGVTLYRKGNKKEN